LGRGEGGEPPAPAAGEAGCRAAAERPWFPETGRWIWGAGSLPGGATEGGDGVCCAARPGNGHIRPLHWRLATDARRRPWFCGDAAVASNGGPADPTRRGRRVSARSMGLRCGGGAGRRRAVRVGRAATRRNGQEPPACLGKPEPSCRGRAVRLSGGVRGACPSHQPRPSRRRVKGLQPYCGPDGAGPRRIADGGDGRAATAAPSNLSSLRRPAPIGAQLPTSHTGTATVAVRRSQERGRDDCMARPASAGSVPAKLIRDISRVRFLSPSLSPIWHSSSATFPKTAYCAAMRVVPFGTRAVPLFRKRRTAQPLEPCCVVLPGAMDGRPSPVGFCGLLQAGLSDSALRRESWDGGRRQGRGAETA